MKLDRQSTGLILRLVGPAVQGIALIGILRLGRQGRTWLGWPVETWCYLGLGVGLALVLVGLGLSGLGNRRSSREV